jgi:CBS domain containing-hemolysin-like protein
MSSVEIVARILSGLGLLSANAFFVTTEFAMTRVPQFDESEFQESAGLQRAWEMTDELEIYLTACQVGITVTSILLGVVFEPGVSALIEPAIMALSLPVGNMHVIAVAVSVILIQFMHTVWGEQSPTYLGVERPLAVARYCAIPLFWWTRFTYPLIYLGDHVAKWTLGLFGVEIERSWNEGEGEIESRAELRSEMGELLSRGRLSSENRQEVMNALEIVELPVRDIMVGREDIISLSTTIDREENFQRLSESHHARYPLVGEEVEDFIGIVYAPALPAFIDDLRDGSTTFEEIAVSPLTVPSDCSVSRLVDIFQAEHQEMALVVEADRVVGLVTATDAFEAIMGELEDPFD